MVLDRGYLRRELWFQIFEYIPETGQLRWTRGNRKGKIAGGHSDERGYQRVKVSGLTYYVHRIVYEMHYGFMEDHLQINHKNYNPADNRIANLELVTASENIRHANLRRVK
jgi:HNH endonuclease